VAQHQCRLARGKVERTAAHNAPWRVQLGQNVWCPQRFRRAHRVQRTPAVQVAQVMWVVHAVQAMQTM
jgi:hypothetical protein